MLFKSTSSIRHLSLSFLESLVTVWITILDIWTNLVIYVHVLFDLIHNYCGRILLFYQLYPLCFVHYSCVIGIHFLSLIFNYRIYLYDYPFVPGEGSYPFFDSGFRFAYSLSSSTCLDSYEEYPFSMIIIMYPIFVYFLGYFYHKWKNLGTLCIPNDVLQLK